MAHLPLHLLEKANGFLLEIHGTVDLRALRSLVPAGLAKLIACDRASLNEAELDEKSRAVIPSPLPPWWSRLGDAYVAHIFDHPLFSSRHTVRNNRVVALNDPRVVAEWKKSKLNHEYFVPLGLKHQLSTAHSRKGTSFLGTAVNRRHRDFSAEERTLFELIAPHIALAWRNAAICGDLKREATAGGSQEAIVIDAASGRMRALSPRAAAILRRHFATDSSGNGRLPTELRRWLNSQRAARTDATQAPLAPLVFRRDGRCFVARLAQMDPAESVLLIGDEPEGLPSDLADNAALTPRENQILDWVVEGKRNAEIAGIIGASTRTVEKHVEHILAKLNVETRTAAIRHSRKFR